MQHSSRFILSVSFVLCFSLGASGTIVQAEKGEAGRKYRAAQVQQAESEVRAELKSLGYQEKECDEVISGFSDQEILELSLMPQAFVKTGQASAGAGGGGGAALALLLLLGLSLTAAAGSSSSSSSGSSTRVVEKTVKEVWETCTACNGKGKRQCTKCSGSGLSQIKDEYGDRLSCDKCGGDGYLSTSCSRCGGRGQVKR